MNDTLLNIVKQIISQYGVDVLDNAQRVKSLFSDLARDVPKPQKIVFLACLEAGFLAILKNAEDKEACKKDLAQRLHDAEGFDVDICEKAIDTLELAVFGNITKTAIQKESAQPQTTPSESQDIPPEINRAVPKLQFQNRFRLKTRFCRKNINALFISRIAAGAVSFIGIADLPYNYYTLLRIAITIISALNAFAFFNSNKFIFSIFCAVTLLFNPVIPMHFSKEIWQAVDLITGVLFWLSLLFDNGFVPKRY